MKDLTLEQFVRENLPDFEMRFAAFRMQENAMYDLMFRNYDPFFRDHFAEALAAYSERLCPEQKEICQQIIDRNYDNGADDADLANTFGSLYRNDSFRAPLRPHPLKQSRR